MPLTLSEIGKTYTITRIGGNESSKHYLENLGFLPGVTVSILSAFSGYYIVMIKGSKVGIDRNLARKIILKEE